MPGTTVMRTTVSGVITGRRDRRLKSGEMLLPAWSRRLFVQFVTYINAIMCSEIQRLAERPARLTPTVSVCRMT